MEPDQIARYGTAARFFNEAMKLSPSEMYESIGTPKPGRIAARVAAYTANELPEVDTAGDTRLLLRYGIENVEDALNFDLKEQPSLEEARAYILHENTLQALGCLARLVHEEMNDQLRAALDKLYAERIRAYGMPGYTTPQHLTIPYEYERPSRTGRGCPAAKHNNSHERTPIFDRAGIWAGLLSLRALAHHGIPKHYSLNNIDPAEDRRLFAMPD